MIQISAFNMNPKLKDAASVSLTLVLLILKGKSILQFEETYIYHSADKNLAEFMSCHMDSV